MTSELRRCLRTWLERRRRTSASFSPCLRRTIPAWLKAGAEEVKEKTGLEAVVAPATGGGWIEEVVATAREAVSSARRFRKHLAVYQAGPGRRRWPSCLLGS